MANKKTSKNKKIIISVATVLIVALMIPCVVFAADYAVMFFTHSAIISSTPDTSEWILENDAYTVVPVIDEDSVTFYVEDKNGDLVFDPKQGWRDWDFKYINLDENSVITALSGDTGEYIYKLDEDGSFYLDSPVY